MVFKHSLTVSNYARNANPDYPKELNNVEFVFLKVSNFYPFNIFY